VDLELIDDGLFALQRFEMLDAAGLHLVSFRVPEESLVSAAWTYKLLTPMSFA
jgi:hypothetical protein